MTNEKKGVSPNIHPFKLVNFGVPGMHRYTIFSDPEFVVDRFFGWGKTLQRNKTQRLNTEKTPPVSAQDRPWDADGT